MKFKFYFLTCFILFFLSACRDNETVSLFPLDHYDQTIATWIKPTDANYDKPLLDASTQQQRMNEFYEHEFLPWSETYINQILHQAAPDDLKTNQLEIIAHYSNHDKTENEIGYGENFHPYSSAWISAIAANINIAQFNQLTYQVNQRGIAIDNLNARVLPTDDPHFYSYKIAGQGYPFDNLQMSALWAGTPVYILTETIDRAWLLVVTPEYIAWVKSNGIAKTNAAFVNEWQAAAKKQLMAITQTKVSIIDHQGIYRFSAYIGAVFPSNEKNINQILIPIANANGDANIDYATLSDTQTLRMPQSVTPHHIANIMSQLIGRPYGWGNLYFYNDCSSELKNLFTPFGLWLPRHSSEQITAGKQVDLSSLTAKERVAYLLQNGHPFLTIIYIDGHIILYVGHYPTKQGEIVMTYQDIWGLKSQGKRAVIGKSVLFPMLLQYPEESNLISLADKKYFVMSYLDVMPSESVIFKLRALMYP